KASAAATMVMAWRNFMLVVSFRFQARSWLASFPASGERLVFIGWPCRHQRGDGYFLALFPYHGPSAGYRLAGGQDVAIRLGGQGVGPGVVDCIVAEEPYRV